MTNEDFLYLAGLELLCPDCKSEAPCMIHRANPTPPGEGLYQPMPPTWKYYA